MKSVHIKLTRNLSGTAGVRAVYSKEVDPTDIAHLRHGLTDHGAVSHNDLQLIFVGGFAK